MCDERTHVDEAESGERGIIVFGDIVNVNSGQCGDLAKWFLDNSACFADIIDKERQFGGQYIIFYREQENYYVMGDATTSIPIFHASTDGDSIVSSYEFVIADIAGFDVDPSLKKIRESAKYAQPMPSDITIYRDIRALLPNHYLELGTNAVKRIVEQKSPKEMISPETAAEIIHPMILNMSRYYTSKYSLDCPLTGGRDSRVVLAYIKMTAPSVRCYTMRHEPMSLQDDDMAVPLEITRELGLEYAQLEDIDPDEETVEWLQAIYRDTPFSKNTLSNVMTVKQFCEGNPIANGDIIGQIGKGSLHRDIPEALASPRYFRSKLHNYSHESLTYIKEWMDEVRSSGERESIFDLFSIENRMGRWAAQTRQVYNLMGQKIVNLFNSRSIIYAITGVSRKDRKNSLIHDELLKRTDPSLRAFRYKNSDGRLERLSKSNGISFYLGSMAKYYIKRRKR